MSKLASPAADRNKDPILSVLKTLLPAAGAVLEIASGSGQHVVHFARMLPHLRWLPSDPNAEARRSIEAWLASEQLPNVEPPIALDVLDRPWPVDGPFDAIVCINLVHISPWPVTAALFAGAREQLTDAGVVYLYGPYKEQGRHTAPSNEAFDRALRAQNPAWGVRNLEDVIETATDAGFEHVATVAMPANNLSVGFRRSRA
jgi:hypothetical protein